MNWYKMSSRLSNGIAVNIAKLLIESYYGVNQATLDKMKNIVSVVTDEETINNAISLGSILAMKKLKIDKLTPDQQQIISQISSNFYFANRRDVPEISPNNTPPINMQPQQNQEMVDLTVPQENISEESVEK